MEKKEYLNEEQYQKTSTKFKNIGKVLLIVGAVGLVIGIILLIAGVIKFNHSAFGLFNTDINNIDSVRGNIQQTATSSFTGWIITFIGILISSFGGVLAIAGGVLLYIGHEREIEAYKTQQKMPIEKEKMEKMTPTVKDSTKEIAKGISEGIEEAQEETKK